MRFSRLQIVLDISFTEIAIIIWKYENSQW